MWNFSELAKQAQQLTVQASASSGGLFNLDAMQGTSHKLPTEKEQGDKSSASVIFNSLSSFQSEGLFAPLAPVPEASVSETTQQPSLPLFDPVKSSFSPLTTAKPQQESKTAPETIAIADNQWDDDWDFDEEVNRSSKQKQQQQDDIAQKEDVAVENRCTSESEPETTLIVDNKQSMEALSHTVGLLKSSHESISVMDTDASQFASEGLAMETFALEEEKPSHFDVSSHAAKDDLDDIYDDDEDDDDDACDVCSHADNDQLCEEISEAIMPEFEPPALLSEADAKANHVAPLVADVTEDTWPDENVKMTLHLGSHEAEPAIKSNAVDSRQEETIKLTQDLRSHEVVETVDPNPGYSRPDESQNLTQDLNGNDAAPYVQYSGDYSRPDKTVYLTQDPETRDAVPAVGSSASVFKTDLEGGTLDPVPSLQTPIQKAVELGPVIQSEDSLEDEIAMMLEEQSQPGIETTSEAFVETDASKQSDFEVTDSDATLKVSHAIQESSLVNGATQRQIDEIDGDASQEVPLELGVSQEMISKREILNVPSQDDNEAESLPDATQVITKELSEKMIPASVLDQFSNQMHRIEEHHQSEIQALQARHEKELQALRDSFDHEQCDRQREELERTLLARLREKDEQLQEVMRINEGLELKKEVLKRELEGTKRILEERESTIGTSSAAHDRAKQLLMDKVKKLEECVDSNEAAAQKLNAQLKTTQNELEEANEAYAALKARVKAVATELKDRRAECRTLAAANVELNDTNERISAQLNTLQAQLNDRDRSEVEKGEEREQLRGKIKALEEELQLAEKRVQERDSVGEKALAAYKKKAQHSLAVANARAATAIQAKEEAELEARAARSTADDAVERARKAEAKGTGSLAEAKAYVEDMEEQMAILVMKAKNATEELLEIRRQLVNAQIEADAARGAREKMSNVMSLLKTDLQLEKNKTSELQQECADLQQRSNDLYDEVETLRDELRKTATAALMGNSKESSGSDTNGGKDGQGRLNRTHVSDKSEAESTILMLQRELQDANQAIKELKETLRSTIEVRDPIDAVAGLHQVSLENSSNKHGGANDSTPLFFAMEKQAELNQAREEINRLANLLGELQSEKVQAFEAVEEMRRDKALAEAKLARYEKLGSGGGGTKRHISNRAIKSSAYGGYGSNLLTRKNVDSDNVSIGSADSTESMDGPSPESAQINLEYLKNVMLSYLKAKTLNERKRLVPAVSAVLCLTPDESAAAMQSVTESASVESVGLSFFEGLKLM